MQRYQHRFNDKVIIMLSFLKSLFTKKDDVTIHIGNSICTKFPHTLSYYVVDDNLKRKIILQYPLRHRNKDIDVTKYRLMPDSYSNIILTTSMFEELISKLSHEYQHDLIYTLFGQDACIKLDKVQTVIDYLLYPDIFSLLKE